MNNLLRALGSRALWLLGTAVPWILAWALLGARGLAILRENPQPFLPNLKLQGPILQAVANWAREALVVHLVLGLLFGLVVHVAGLAGREDRDPDGLGFRGGLLTGLGALLLFHAALYVQVPMALHSLHGLRALPIGAALLVLAGAGLACLFLAYRRIHRRLLPLRLGGALLALVLLSLVPHDLFRRSPAAAELPDATPRLLVFGLDGVRRDLAEEAVPGWRLPEGVSAVPSVPATRKAWLTLMGSDAEYSLITTVIPTWKEFLDPDGMALVSLARQRGLQAAWAINDPTTLSFGMLQNRFAQVSEPPGGWTYWFMLGFGTLWPANTWAQNFLSPIETTNTWSDRAAYHRDLDRLLARHHWTSAHNVELHSPIVLQRQELQDLEGGWGWLLQPAWKYRVYATRAAVEKDNGLRASPRNDAERHYRVRLRRSMRDLGPWLDRWSARYPNLSGVFTSDHGELHVPIQTADGEVRSHLGAIHGYVADPDTFWIPMRPFGQARFSAARPQTVSWFDLRDAIQRWVLRPGPLEIQGNPEGWMIQFPTIDPSAVTGEHRSAAPASGSARVAKVAQIADGMLLSPNGYWFLDNLKAEEISKGPKSTGLAVGTRLVTFNPLPQGRYSREEFEGYLRTDARTVTQEERDQELARFRGSRPRNLPAAR